MATHMALQLALIARRESTASKHDCSDTQRIIIVGNGNSRTTVGAQSQTEAEDLWREINND